MSSVGRVRGLAAALGVGAAFLTGCGIAAADPGSPDSSSDGASSAHDAATGSATTAGPTRGSAGGARTSRTAGPTARTTGPRAAATAETVTRAGGESPGLTTTAVIDTATTASLSPGLGGRSPAVSARIPPPPPVSAAASADPADQPAVVRPTAVAVAEPAVISAENVTSSPIAALPPQALATSAAAPLAAASTPLSSLSSAPAPDPDLATTGMVMLLALTNVLHMAVVLTVAALTPAPPSPSTVTPTLHIGGVDFVPSSPRDITSFYGRWTYLPGAPSMVQGTQQFDVVDPETAQKLGSFNALVSRGTGIDYTSLLVTSSDGGNGSAKVPPVGALMSNFQIGRIGLQYSDIPAPSGNIVSFTITTPSGNIVLPLKFDAAKGIADRTIDNRPMGLGNGFSIAPADPAGETLTAISGILPLFTTVQGHQVFNVNDPAGKSVGSFDGVFTTTSDIMGTYTQALMVTGNDGVNVGSGAGQVPPVGTVYNVIYRESDAHFYLYTSMPSASGSQVSVIEVKDGQVTHSALTFIDASKPVANKALSGAGGYRFVPVTALVPSGVNGLPPRDVQIQGYQRYDVYDAKGARIGSVDADVSTQWDLFGIESQALLVTKVTEDVAGTMPPVGSVFNFLQSGSRGFGSAHSVQPLASGDLTSFKLVTPFGDINLPSSLVPATSRTQVSYFSPFPI